VLQSASLLSLRIGVVLGLLLAAGKPSPAQSLSTEIEGKLVSPVGKPPCSFCQVQLEDKHGSTGMTLASGSGEFRFRNLREEIYKVRVKSVDFEEVSITVFLNAEVTRVTIDLQPRKSETIPSSSEPVINLSTALESQSRDIVALYKKAQKNLMSNRFVEAAVQYESLTNSAPKLYVAHFDLGLSYEAIGRIEDAEREFQISRQLNASNADPLIHLSETYILRGEWGWATEASIGAIRLDSQSPRPFLNLGLARLILINIHLNDHDDRSALEQLDLYFSKSTTRSRSAELTALRARLKSGAPHEDGLEVAIPISIGSVARKNACRK